MNGFYGVILCLLLMFISNNATIAQSTIKVKGYTGGPKVALLTLRAMDSQGRTTDAITDTAGICTMDLLKEESYTWQIIGAEQLKITSVEHPLSTEYQLTISGSAPARDLPEVVVTPIDLRWRKTYEWLPATQNDPARLALLLPGATVSNDGANGIVFEGLPPELTRWQINGITVLPPNHLSNAGTLSDRAAYSAGGISALTQRMLLNVAYTPVSRLAWSGMTVQNRFRTGDMERWRGGAQVGIIGMEGHIEGPLVKNYVSMLVGGRYSTVGLLSLAGIDFGGEKIGFGELSAVVNAKMANHGELQLYGVQGASFNRFKGIADPTKWTRAKDRQNIDYNEKIGVYGFSYHKFWNKYLLRANFSNSITSTVRQAVWFGETGEPQDTVTDNGRVNIQRLKLGFQSFIAAKRTYALEIEFMRTAGYNQIGQWGNPARDLLVNSVYAFEGRTFVFKFDPASDNSTYVGMNFWHGLSGQYGGVSPFMSLQRKRLGATITGNALWVPWQLTMTPLKSNNVLDAIQMHHISVRYKPLMQETTTFLARWTVEGFFNQLSRIPESTSGWSMFNGLSGFAGERLTSTGQAMSYGIKSDMLLQKNGWRFSSQQAFVQSGFKSGKDGYQLGRYFAPIQVAAQLGWRNNPGLTFRSYGFSVAGYYRTGFRDQSINEAVSYADRSTIHNLLSPFSIKYNDYYRADIRIFKSVQRKKTIQQLSLDIQNVTSRLNDGAFYFDSFTNKIELSQQLALVPMISWRIEWLGKDIY
jgi:hypothetical protein